MVLLLLYDICLDLVSEFLSLCRKLVADVAMDVVGAGDVPRAELQLTRCWNAN